MHNQFWLLICDESGRSGLIELQPGVHTIGRSEDCAIRLGHLSVSRHHAEVVLRNGSLRIRDLQSLNGTCVNDAPVTHSELKAGDSVDIGRVRLEVLASAAQVECMGGDESLVCLPEGSSPGVLSSAEQPALRWPHNALK